jgi:hypothetical protein
MENRIREDACAKLTPTRVNTGAKSINRTVSGEVHRTKHSQNPAIRDARKILAARTSNSSQSVHHSVIDGQGTSSRASPAYLIGYRSAIERTLSASPQIGIIHHVQCHHNPAFRACIDRDSRVLAVYSCPKTRCYPSACGIQTG